MVLVAAVGLEPTTFGLCLPTTVFTATDVSISVCSLDFLFTLFIKEGGCPPSSLYTFPDEYVGAWLGITTLKASPNLTDDHPDISVETALCEMSFQASRYSADFGFRCRLSVSTKCISEP